MGSLKVLDSKGHTEVEWDVADPATVEKAVEEFNKAVDRGLGAFDTSAPEGGVAYDTREGFTTEIESMTLVPRMAGG